MKAIFMMIINRVNKITYFVVDKSTIAENEPKQVYLPIK